VLKFIKLYTAKNAERYGRSCWDKYEYTVRGICTDEEKKMHEYDGPIKYLKGRETDL